jgi:hypothetical protein
MLEYVRVSRIEAFLYEAAPYFEVYSNIQKPKLKNQKPIAVVSLSDAIF